MQGRVGDLDQKTLAGRGNDLAAQGCKTVGRAVEGPELRGLERPAVQLEPAGGGVPPDRPRSLDGGDGSCRPAGRTIAPCKQKAGGKADAGSKLHRRAPRALPSGG